MAYAPGDVLVRTIMSAASGLVEDQVVNDFAFHYDVVGNDTQLNFLMDLCGDFFRLTYTGGFSVGQFISNQVSRAATHEIQAWRLHAGPLGSPDLTKAWLGPVAASDADGLPTEVAGCLSFHASLTGVLEEVGATRPRARRRGRIYVGPLTVEAVDTTAPPYVLNPSFTGTLREAAVRLGSFAGNELSTGEGWGVWSRADQTVRKVVGGWTDNAPDTQRRRGFSPTVRNVFQPVAWQ